MILVSKCYHSDITRYGWCRTGSDLNSKKSNQWGLCMRSCEFRPGEAKGLWEDERRRLRLLETARFQTLPGAFQALSILHLAKITYSWQKGLFVTTVILIRRESCAWPDSFCHRRRPTSLRAATVRCTTKAKRQVFASCRGRDTHFSTTIIVSQTGSQLR